MDDQLLQITYTLPETDEVAKRFWEIAQNQRILAFSGDMGAGKTTFIRSLCNYLHVADPVSSPTFALINEYHFNNDTGQDEIIYHLDWYRLRDSGEAINAGMEDCIIQAKNGQAFCFIEWPEKAPELLHPPFLWISLTVKTPVKREMKVRRVVSP